MTIVDQVPSLNLRRSESSKVQKAPLDGVLQRLRRRTIAADVAFRADHDDRFSGSAMNDATPQTGPPESPGSPALFSHERTRLQPISWNDVPMSDRNSLVDTGFPACSRPNSVMAASNASPPNCFRRCARNRTPLFAAMSHAFAAFEARIELHERNIATEPTHRASGSWIAGRTVPPPFGQRPLPHIGFFGIDRRQRSFQGNDSLVLGERRRKPQSSFAFGKIVPFQAAFAESPGGRTRLRDQGGPKSTAATASDGGACGRWASSSVQSLPTSERTASPFRSICAGFGSQTSERGGPNTANVFIFAARSVVVNLASSDEDAADGGGGERLLAEVRVDLAFVLVVELQPIASRSDGRNTMFVGRSSSDRLGFQANVQVLGVVAAPVEPFRAAEPFVLAAPPQLALVGAELEHGDLVGLGVAEQPFVGVEAVVAVDEDPARRRRCCRRTAAPGGMRLASDLPLALNGVWLMVVSASSMPASFM